MKKNLLTFLAILPVAAIAQQLESDDIIGSVGDSTAYYVMKDPGTIAAPIAGSNSSTWDFSTMKFDDSTDFKFEAPVTTGFQQDPDNTTIAEQFSGRRGDRIQYKSTSSDLYIMGVRSGFTQTSYGKDSLLKFKFPAKFNDSHTTILNSETRQFGITTYRTGAYKTTIDGYGKLVLPYGDLKDVFRVKIEMDYQDSARIFGRPRVTTYSTATYEYWQKGSISYVMQVMYEDDDGTKETKVIYRKGAEVIFNPTGVASVNGNRSLNLFPNPANQFITIELSELNSNSQYRIFNILGETKLEGTFKSSNRVNVEELNTGLYFVEIVGENFAPVRFLKK